MDGDSLKKVLQVCMAGDCLHCSSFSDDDCMEVVAGDSLNYIAELEERIAIKDEALEALEQRCKTLDAYETARLMTWEEVLKIAEHNYNAKWDEMENVWLEGHESLIFGFAEPQIMGSYIELFTAGDECGYDCDESEYMKKYRCWTNRPTKEQRAVEWE